MPNPVFDSHRPLALAVAALVGLTACGDDSSPTDPGDDDGGPTASAVVVGSVESTVSGGGGAASGPAGAPASDAETVAVASVAADGSVTVHATADVDASNDFRDAPALVIARSSSDDPIGRVMVHGETEANTTTTVAPIDAETTVEALAWAELRASGEPAAENRGGLALFVRMDGPEAEATAQSSAHVDAVADAYAAAQAVKGAAFTELGVGLDLDARAQLTASLVADMVAARDAGTPPGAAHESFAAATFDAYESAGASAEAIVLAEAAATTAALRSTGALAGDAQVAVHAHAVDLQLQARERLAADVSSQPGATAVADALAQARADLAAATTPVDVQGAVLVALEAANTAVLSSVLDLLSGVPISIRGNVESELVAAIDEARLDTRLEGETGAVALASAVADYRADVRTAVEAVDAEMPPGESLDVDAFARLMVAAYGNAGID